MFIKSSFCGGIDNALIHLSEAESYELRCRFSDGLYLILRDREIMLRAVSRWSDDYQQLPDYAVDDLYGDMLDAITERLSSGEEVRVIDIDDIEVDLLENKYRQQWLERGYITPKEAENL